MKRGLRILGTGAARWLGAALLCAAANAHEVRERVLQAPATVIVLAYADDQPFSYERYELFVPGRDRPVQTGLTDAKGRIVFLPDDVKRWRLRSFSSDGHGVDFEFDAATPPAGATVAAPGSDRPWRVALGLAVIAALAGALQWLALRRRRRAEPGPPP